AYYSTTGYRYLTDNYATYYQQQASTGTHAWYVAPSGTAGAAITWTGAMQIDSAGVVTISGTGDGILVVAGKITAKAAVPGSFDDSSLANLAADIQSYLASILT